MDAIMKVVAGVAIVSAIAFRASQPDNPPKDQLPQFTKDGRLMRPHGYQEWVLMGASTGLSYAQSQNPPAPGASPGMFHNVYLQPWAYRYTMEHGAFPENAMLVLTFFESSRKSTPARAGFYEGDRIPGFEVHLKRKNVDPTGWGFYGFGDTASTSAKAPSDAACYTCHRTEAAFDNAFVQFYPMLREKLLAKADSQLRSAQ
ncbi:MAG TPA: cytochrome P460 family protein [Gemmatimonadales bacterium]|nr:cytochrome P460 family protein [Gemmatimonadales bacterium]